MKKLSRGLGILTLGLMLSVSWTTMAHAEPITIALFGSAFASTFAGTIVSSLIGAGISWLGAQVINWLFPPEDPKGSDSKLTIRFGERVARLGIVGTVLLGGHMAHVNEYNNAKTLQLVQILADQRISDIKKARVNGKMYDLVSLTTNNNAHKRYKVDGLKDTIEIRLHDGRVGQAADTNLVTQNSGWDSTKKFSGMAYIVSEVQSNREIYSGSPPEIIPVVEGGLWYDPRKDSSVGGSGTHRFNDPSTWEYTANPAVVAYHYCRGVYFNGIRVLGAGIPPAKLDFATFVAAMNACDEIVEDPNGNDRKRYECHMVFDDTDQYGSVLDRLCTSMGGFWAEREGKIAIFAGKAQSVVAALTDEDLIDNGPLQFSDKRAGETLYQGIMGTYTSPKDWEELAYKAIMPSEFDIYGLEPKIMEQHFDMIQDPHQAFLVAKIKLFANNMQATASLVLDIKSARLQVGDWVTYTSTSLSFIGTRTYVVVGATYSLAEMRMHLTLQEISTDVYADSATAGDIVVPTRELPIAGYLTAVSNPVITPISIAGANNENLPGLQFTYDPIQDPAVTGVHIEYRIVGTEEKSKVTDTSPQDGVYFTTMGIAPGQQYEARFMLATIAGREVDWSEWQNATDLTDNFTVGAAIPTYMEQQLARVAALRSLADDIRQLSTIVQNMDRENFFMRDELNTAVQVQMGNLQASFTEIIQVQIDPMLGALASRVDTLFAAMGDNTASVKVKWEAVAGPTGYGARYQVVAAAEDDDAYRSAVFFLDVPVNTGDPTRIGFMAGQVVYYTSGGDPIALLDENGIMRSANDAVVIDFTTGDFSFGAG